MVKPINPFLPPDETPDPPPDQPQDETPESPAGEPRATDSSAASGNDVAGQAVGAKQQVDQAGVWLTAGSISGSRVGGGWLVAALPWSISVLLHVGVVLLAIVAIWATVIRTEEADLAVPSLELAELPAMPLELVMNDRPLPEVTTSQPMELPELPEIDPLVDQVVEPLDFLGPSDAAVGDPFVAAVDASSVQFFGTEAGNARRIVFIVDGSLRLIGEMIYIQAELRQTIQALNPEQRFTVLMFRDDDDEAMVELPPVGLQPARTTYKAEALPWVATLNEKQSQRGSVIDAMKRAVSYEPDLIVLLSDQITGEAQYEIDRDELLDQVRAVLPKNRQGQLSRELRINTVQFIYPDPAVASDRQEEGTMGRISRMTGGEFRFIRQEQLE